MSHPTGKRRRRRNAYRVRELRRLAKAQEDREKRRATMMERLIQNQIVSLRVSPTSADPRNLREELQRFIGEPNTPETRDAIQRTIQNMVFPLIRRQYFVPPSNWIPIQPMPFPSGAVFYVDYLTELDTQQETYPAEPWAEDLNE